MKHVRAVASDVRLTETARAAGTVADYIALTKPRLNVLVVATSAAGYYMGASGSQSPWGMAPAVIGTALVAGGAATLNQLYERDTDALMQRTRLRPLPTHRVGTTEARVFGLVLTIAGLGLLLAQTNVGAAALALATVVTYLAIYTPMKRRTSLATLVGAVPGALPPLIGWTAAQGQPTLAGVVLFGIVFLWQIPHFMAIAWLCRDDYGKAGFPMLPVIEPDGRRAGRQAVLYAIALLPVSVIPALNGSSGNAYFAVASVLGAALLWLAAQFARDRTDLTARRLFLGSIAYLPLLWIAMIADRL